MSNEAPNTCMKIDESANFNDLYEAISERLVKARSLLNCLVVDAHHSRLGSTTLDNVLWCLGSLVDEAEALRRQTWDAYCSRCGMRPQDDGGGPQT